ncbi:MAG: DEAD/DEAH box helicase family protein [Oscillospiraceae bacterium]
MFSGHFSRVPTGHFKQLRKSFVRQKIHIVAAPGSGKTILGLELIRKIGKPALILSPTVIIQHQWGQRFNQCFLPSEREEKVYFSYSLQENAPLTSLTYQGLYAAWNKLEYSEESDDFSSDLKIDYKNIDLPEYVKQQKIGVICLDEAHHLKRNWQAALERFVCAVEKDLTIIALTATPPYDSSSTEWGRYLSLCGEVDEEISVPALVKQGVLCPHQDFIYFNQPTQAEELFVFVHQKKANKAVKSILQTDWLHETLLTSGIFPQDPNKEQWIFQNTRGVSALLVLAQNSGIELPKELKKQMFTKGIVPFLTVDIAQEAFQFVIDSPNAFTEVSIKQLKKYLSADGLIIKSKVCLKTTETLSKLLNTSKGKLQSIAAIANEEQKNLGDALRMLVLTDHIGKGMLSVIGTDYALSELSAVPVFETIRRSVLAQTPIAILTGTVVVLPEAAVPVARQICIDANLSFFDSEMQGVGYSEVSIGSKSSDGVLVLTSLFQQGFLHIIVGTKALLGEGWDSPCINSLVIASFVGSFVSTNQMRGRAIRRDPSVPQKASNIWHLATIMPSLDIYGNAESETLYSADYFNMVRRFDCFMAPAYHRPFIESGIQRIDSIKPPYTNEGIQAINTSTLTIAKERSQLFAKWEDGLGNSSLPEVLDADYVPFSAAPPRFLFFNLMHMGVITTVFAVALNILYALFFCSNNTSYVIGAMAVLAVSFFAFRSYTAILRVLSPKRFVKTAAGCLLQALQELGEITSPNATLFVCGDTFDVGIECALSGANIREKSCFAKRWQSFFLRLIRRVM